MTLLEFLAQNIVKASVLLAAAFAASWVLRNRAAALRHFVWTAAMAALLLLPFAIAVAPQRGWRTMPVKQTVAAVAHGSVRVSQAPAAPSSPRLPLLLLAWVAGFLAVGVRFARGAARTARMVRRATPAPAAEAGEMARGVRLLESAEAPMPLVWGIRRPAVVLPLEARGWPAERLRTVVLHERMHVERGDLVAQALGQAACCLYWFHPLVWLAARRLRTERERACDDAVLLRGVLAHDYAGHLLALVQSLAARKAGWASVAGMAESSGLESRVRALLDRRRRRHPLSRRAALAVSAAGLALILPLATLSTSAQVTRGGLAGVVKDPSGARVPGTEVTARNLDDSNQEVTHCNAAAEYRFAAIPPGHYELQFSSPGFKMLKVPVTVTAGEVARVDGSLEIGSITQAVTVTAQKPASASVSSQARPAGAAQRIKIGGNVQAARLITQPRPVYPEDAKQQGLEGTVMIRAIISKTGDVLSAKVVNTEVDARFAQAALDAVRQWRYEPTLLNGEPVEVLTSVTVDFKLN